MALGRTAACFGLQVIGFCPTGWMYEMKKKTYPVRSKGANSIHLVPYSEHSSYSELLDYVRFLKPHKVSRSTSKERRRMRFCAL